VQACVVVDLVHVASTTLFTTGITIDSNEAGEFTASALLAAHYHRADR
jgi:hypothetical protein